MMARIYSDTGRYGESLAAARTATRLIRIRNWRGRPRTPRRRCSRRSFLGSKGDDLPPVDALGMFYEFRELTPIGRRGDEMIRRLADRLVAVDLLDQAAELLQYQVDKRLEGAARAQVAARLAMVYLTNRKPDRAIAALRTTRIADLSGELRQQRLLLEARAQSDVGRHDLALDIISQHHRPRGDPAALRHLLGVAALARGVRTDRTVLRRSLARFQTAEPGGEGRHHPRRGRIRAGRGRHRAGAVPRKICAADERRRRPRRLRDRQQAEPRPSAPNSPQIAKMAASVDTLDGFLREMKTRFPDATARSPEASRETGKDSAKDFAKDPAKAEADTTGSLPRINGVKQADAAR